jgi:3-oxoacyl-[acyl-carrier protein] reductase
VGMLDGKVVIVTGAGSGLGREHVLAMAAQGAHVVVNDLRPEAATATVDAVRAAGGEATPFACDVADVAAAESLVRTAIDTYGDLHVLLNNAGFLRDAMSFSMTEDEFDSVVRVHLKGHWAPSRAAAVYWRDRSKDGAQISRRMIHTASESGLFGGPAQTNYASAKGGILSMSLSFARELAKYGVSSNCVAPRARTPMTSHQKWTAAPEDPDVFDKYHPGNVSPFVVWLASDAAAEVNGQTFIVGGSVVVRMRSFHAVAEIRTEGRWTAEDLGGRVGELFAEVDPGLPPFAAPSF